MDARGGKILEFLKENSHLDLEVPDIAFNVKKSEKTVEAALKKYQQKGLVTARQNEFGRVYWYALPSAPQTKVLKVDELLQPEARTAPAVGGDDEVDLFSLPNAASSPVPVKSRKSEKKHSVPVKKSPQRENELFPTAELETVVAAVPADFEPAATAAVSSEIVAIEESDVDEMNPPAKTGGVLLVVVALVAIIAGSISVMALMRGGKAFEKIDAMGKTIPRDVVATADFKPVQEQAAKIGELEAEVTALAAKVDSISAELARAREPEPPPPPPVRRPVRRRR